MFTIYRPELAGPAVELRDQHRSFLAGQWDRTGLAEHQLTSVRRTLRYVKENSSFYRAHLAAVDPSTITALDERALAGIPFTTKDDLRAAQHGLLSRPLADAWIFYETTGTTGCSTPCPRDDIDSLANNTVLTHYYGTVFRQYGDDQVIGVAGPTELHAFSDTFGDVCRNLGLAVAKMWPHSPMVGFDRALEVMRSFPITGLFCTPGMALMLAKRAVAAGLDPRRDFRLDVLMTTGELASPSLIANLGEIWGAHAYNALYASQEASVMGAAATDGRLYTAPLISYNEVVDPETDRWVQPDADGTREGELVVTHLYQGAKPLVRYRTGDLVRITDPRPGQSVPAPSIAALGRVRDRLALNGHLITGYDLEHLLLRHLRGYLDYQITIDRVDGTDRLSLTLQLPGRAGAAAVAQGAARAVEQCRDELGTELEVGTGTLGSITTTGAMVSWKAARVIDLRAGGQDAEASAAAKIAAGRTR
ncbi:phenylacetate--CoA ligase family protein [Kitasatospora sp. NBC_01250]|uniref:phenylacetate--CoA ligase family protein n=1 Tax=Kitasatospora sp. NBC_01250 TaxID=2903571 RepID=UPI002E2F3386|nr:phenylacetate--CoA ligase family protein [Kitasatospora sp. NBC_01250]